jgi:hypothetical protein
MNALDHCRRAALVSVFVSASLTFALSGFAQEIQKPPVNPGAADSSNPADHRILGVLPNYRTANPMDVYQPLTTRQKFTIAVKDSFDWPNYLVSGLSAGVYQIQNQNPSFGQGVKGYAHRYWTSYIDQSMGNLMTEAVMPTLLREDPRYFRKVTGSGKNRLFYALTRVVVTRTDAGGPRFNFSEVIGNGVMASVGNAYYPDNRGVSPTAQRMGTQIATDSFSNVLKEFWPDVKRRFFTKHSDEGGRVTNSD